MNDKIRMVADGYHNVNKRLDQSMRFLIDRGIDMTIKDYRWGSNAASWARAGYNNEKMAQWLEDAERGRARVVDR